MNITEQDLHRKSSIKKEVNVIPHKIKPNIKLSSMKVV
jgi:hypothetical protein